MYQHAFYSSEPWSKSIHQQSGYELLRFGKSLNSKCDIVQNSIVGMMQGEEAKVVILSLVRNNKEGRIGFLKERNRVAVLLSRAMHGMYILGNELSLEMCKSDDDTWKQVLNMLHEEDHIGNALEVIWNY